MVSYKYNIDILHLRRWNTARLTVTLSQRGCLNGPQLCTEEHALFLIILGEFIGS